MKHLIIGGVAGGATAAARIRRADELAEIVLIEKGKYISYANCGLPYYIGGTITDRQRLFVQTPESFGKRFKVDVRTENEAIEIDTAAKSVTIRRNDGTTYKESYDRLLLSPGASPVRPPLEGIDGNGIFTLRNVSDTDKIKSYISGNEVNDAIVVGGGFIGLELAENLRSLGLEVTIVQGLDRLLTPLDYDMASFIHAQVRQKGIRLLLNSFVEGFEERNPNLKLIGAYIHMDEASPHLHLDYVPVAYGYSRGLEIRNSLDKAMKQMGFQPENESRKNNATKLWKENERVVFGQVCRDLGLEVEPERKSERKSLTVDEYKEARDEMLGHLEKEADTARQAAQDARKELRAVQDKAEAAEEIPSKARLYPYGKYIK